MTIYLAGPWVMKSEMRYVRGKLQAAGIVVQADWIDHHQDTHTYAELQEQAYHDLAQIDGSDAFVIMAYAGVKSEGKASEFMFAYCNKKPIVVVGDRTMNIFYNLPNVTIVNTIQEAIDALRQVGAPKPVVA